MPITNLHTSDIGPFDEIGFEFDDQVNVFTGPNNSGKSTVLWMLGELLVYPFTIPDKVYRSDSPKWTLHFSTKQGVESITGNLPSDPVTMLHAYEVVGHTCFVPAQRHGTNFRATGPSVGQNIESRIDDEAEMLARERPTVLRKHGIETLRQYFRESRNSEPTSLTKRRKLMLSGTTLIDDKAMIQKIIDLDYAAYRQQRPAMRGIVDKVISIASEITDGFSVQFVGVGEDEDGLFPRIGTPEGILPLDVLSHGTQSIIQCLAYLVFGYADYYDFPLDLEERPGILIIDEIDVHLHPSWQRRIIPTLTRYFPKLQIFCSTHSPLMLTGLKAGQVQLLRRGRDGKVTVSTNESDIAGWTADEVLRNFLEISTPTDITTSDRVNRLHELRHKENLSMEETKELQHLRNTVREDLLSGPTSVQVAQFAEELKRIRIRSEPDSTMLDSIQKHKK